MGKLPLICQCTPTADDGHLLATTAQAVEYDGLDIVYDNIESMKQGHIYFVWINVARLWSGGPFC